MAGESAASDNAEADLSDGFLRSMPAAYAHAFGAHDIDDHAGIAARRGERIAHLELWRTLPGGLTVLCVVADDRAGLLSSICRVLVARDLDVVSAQIYCRKRPNGLAPEAFDLFWVRPHRGSAHTLPFSANTVAALSAALARAVAEEDRTTVPAGRPDAAVSAALQPRVFFNTNSLRRGEYVLVVEAPDCPGLLLAISLALHRQGIEIGASDVRTEGGIARDCFTLAVTGGIALSAPRLAAVRQAVVEAVRSRLAES